MGKNITAAEFFQAFMGEWANWKFSATAPFEGRRQWTERMLREDGFFAHVMRRLTQPDRRLAYWRETYTVDAMYVGGDSLFGSGKGRFDEPLTYASKTEVLIEHEFDEWLQEEMWKLIFWRAPLKVIVGYDWSEPEKRGNTRRTNWRNDTLTDLSNMLTKANGEFAENPATEYLLLIATRTRPGAPLVWMAESISGSGRIVLAPPADATGSRGPLD